MNQGNANSIQSNRRRLLLLLLRAFGIVVFLTVVLILLVSAMAIGTNTRRNPFYLSPTSIILETYYLGMAAGRGYKQSWKSAQTPPFALYAQIGSRPSCWMPAGEWCLTTVLPIAHGLELSIPLSQTNQDYFYRSIVNR